MRENNDDDELYNGLGIYSHIAIIALCDNTIRSVLNPTGFIMLLESLKAMQEDKRARSWNTSLPR